LKTYKTYKILISVEENLTKIMVKLIRFWLVLRRV